MPTPASLSPLSLTFNIRTLQAAQSGVQRYARELDRRWGPHIARVRPAHQAQGVHGHIWEQCLLPAYCRGRLLFSPGNTGPLACRDQVVTIHDASTFDHPEAFSGLFGRWYRWLLPRLARRVRAIITVSQFSRERLSKRLGISPEKIVVIPNGVTPPVPRSEELIAQDAEQLRLPPRFLLFVGTQDPRKNVQRLIEAFSRARLGDIELLLAGGADSRLFQSDGQTLSVPRVRTLGRVSDTALETLYRRAEGFVFPSLYEGFGLPPLEAMARGCPVLSSNATCLPEICGPSWEQNGACLYFAPDSTEAITATLERFCNISADTRQSMIEAGRRHAARFSWDRCAQATLNVLHRYAGLPVSDESTTTPSLIASTS